MMMMMKVITELRSSAWANSLVRIKALKGKQFALHFTDKELEVLVDTSSARLGVCLQWDSDGNRLSE